MILFLLQLVFIAQAPVIKPAFYELTKSSSVAPKGEDMQPHPFRGCMGRSFKGAL